MRKIKSILYSSCIAIAFSACVGEDIIQDEVPERVTIANPVETLAVGGTHQFTATFWNNVGMEESADLVWASSNTDVVTITNQGLATGVGLGDADITVSLDGRFDVSQVFMVRTGDMTVEVEETVERAGALRTTSSYALAGDFTLSDNNGSLELTFAQNFVASSSLPGLYVYLTNNPNTINGALEIGPVTSFAGAHSYTVPGTVDINDYSYVLMYCKPFVVKVGDGEFQN